MGHFRWTPENIEKLRELKHAGKSNTTIAKHFNVSEECVTTACNRYNIRMTVKWTPEKIDEVRNMITQGLTYKQIGDKFGVSESSVKNAIRRHMSNKETKEMSNSIALRKQAEELLKAASEMEERENFNKHKHHLRNKLNEIINDYDHLGEKIEELKEMLK